MYLYIYYIYKKVRRQSALALLALAGHLLPINKIRRRRSLFPNYISTPARYPNLLGNRLIFRLRRAARTWRDSSVPTY